MGEAPPSVNPRGRRPPKTKGSAEAEPCSLDRSRKRYQPFFFFLAFIFDIFGAL